MKFSFDKKGYNTAEVDAYLKKLAADYTRVVDGLRQKVEMLNEQAAEKDKELAAHKRRAGMVAKAITAAVSKAEEIEKRARDRYEREIDRLKAFHERWVAYYKRILDHYPIDEDLAALGEFNREMSKILSAKSGEPFSEDLEENYKREKARHAGRRIGYITVSTSEETDDETDDEDYDPIGRIQRFLSADKERPAGSAPLPGPKISGSAKQKQSPKNETAAAKDRSENVYSDRSESGYSFSEALNPTDDLEQIMKDLGILLEEGDE